MMFIIVLFLFRIIGFDEVRVSDVCHVGRHTFIFGQYTPVFQDVNRFLSGCYHMH